MKRTLCLLIALLPVGCGKREAEPPRKEVLKPPGVLVTPAWLDEHRKDERLVIVDVRPPEEYAKEHIEGAVNLPVKQTFDKEGKEDLEKIEVISDLVGKAGIDMQTTVVLYDNKDYRMASRMLWVLEVHGHSLTAVLNGALAGWKKANKPTSTEPTTRPAKKFVAELQNGRLATKLGVAKIAQGDGSSIIVDARSLDEFKGLKSEFKRKGHIPSAVSLDFLENMETVDGVCSIMSHEQLLKKYENLDKSKKIITYCNTGQRASVSYLALRVLGYDAAVYDGSWKEWSGDETMKVEVPEETPEKTSKTKSE